MLKGRLCDRFRDAMSAVRHAYEVLSPDAKRAHQQPYSHRY